MRYSFFSRICPLPPCPERLPATLSPHPDSTASDEFINIIKANMPYHFFPAKVGGLAMRCELSGRPGGGWHWSENQTWRLETVRWKEKRWKGGEKRKEGEIEGESFYPVVAKKCHSLSSALSGALERWSEAFGCSRVELWSLAAGGDEICYDCSESYLARPQVTAFQSSTLLFTGWHA